MFLDELLLKERIISELLTEETRIIICTWSGRTASVINEALLITNVMIKSRSNINLSTGSSKTGARALTAVVMK